MPKRFWLNKGGNELTALEEYIRKYGYDDLIPVNWFSSDKYRSVDDVYKESLKRGITWRQLTGWNVDKDKYKIL